MTINLDELTPPHIVAELDKYIIGQTKAKKAVAVALRNRTRRLKLSEEIREEIAPKNILMIGPTGVGKTEIARRLAKLSGAPFLKVEATKYTEVGYVGRDVESMIRDLMAVGFSMVKSEMQETLKAQAEKNTEEILLDLLLPGSNKKKRNRKESPKPLLIAGSEHDAEDENSREIRVEVNSAEDDNQAEDDMHETREKFRKMLRDGKFEDKMVEVSVQQSGMPSFEIFAGGSNMEDLENAMSNISSMLMGAGKNKRKTTSVKEARTIIMDDQLDKLVDHDKIVEEAKDPSKRAPFKGNMDVQKLEELIQEIKSENPHFDANYEIEDMRTSWHTKKEDELIQGIMSSLKKLEINPVFDTFTGSTDASMLIKNNLIPVIIGPGDLSVVHRENEYDKIVKNLCK